MKIYNKSFLSHLPDAVFFDADNTLYAYDPAHRSALCAVRDKACSMFHISSSTFDDAFGKAKCEIKATLGNVASSHSRLLYFQKLLEGIGLGSQLMLALEFEQTYWRTFLVNATLFAGLKDLLDDFRLLGIPMAVVTDLTAQIQFRKIVYFGLDKYFDFIVTSEEAGCEKPDSVPFKLALNKISPTPTRVWMIGDSAANDILGAREAIGAITFQKLHQGVLEGTGNMCADVVFDEFSQIRKLLKSVGG